MWGRVGTTRVSLVSLHTYHMDRVDDLPCLQCQNNDRAWVSLVELFETKSVE